MDKLCPICNRELGTRVDKHHLIPKTFKGKVTIVIHKICHRFIHATWTERELLNTYNNVEAMLAQPVMQRFVAWVKKKPIDFYDGSDTSSAKKNKKR